MWQKQEHDVDLGLTNLLTTRQLVKGKDVQPTVFNHLKLPIIILQSASAILITCYFELSLSRSFSLVPSEVSVTALITSFGAMNHHYLKFHHVELLTWSIQGFLWLFSSIFLNTFISLTFKCWKNTFENLD